MVDNINTNTMVGKVVAVCIALLFIVVLAFPIANSLSNGGNSDESQFNDGSIGAKLDYYTTSPTAKTVEVTNDGTNIVLSGDYSDTYSVGDMVLMVSDTQSLVVQDGVMYYNNGVTTVPTESVTLSLDSSGLNGKPYQWVYFPTEDGTFGSFADSNPSNGVTVASYNGISVIAKDGEVVDSPFGVKLTPISENGKVVGYDVSSNVSAPISDYKEDGLWKFKVEYNNAVIVEYLGTETISELVVPSSVTADGETYTVIGIHNDQQNSASILSNKSILANTSLILPNTLTSIGDYAFNYCTGFTGSLTIPNSVISIGDNSFEGCSGFTGLTLGNAIETIDKSAFNYCTGFTGSLIIPNSLITVGDSAFKGCSGFTGSLNLNSLKNIGYSAFNNCTGFTGSLIIPDSVTYIGNRAFQNTNLTVPSGQYTQDNWKFDIVNGGVRLYAYTGTVSSSFVIPDTINVSGVSYPVKQIGYGLNSVIPYTSVITNLVLPNSLVKIGPNAFTDCQKITGNLIIPDSVEIIGGSAFYNCKGFTGSLVIPDSVEVIGIYGFYGCTGFTGTLTIGDSLTHLEDSVFSGCTGFTGSLVIPDSVTHIDNQAFYRCTGFTGSLVIPDSVTYIGTSAFHQCSGLNGSLTLSESLTTLEDSVFCSCSGFTGSLVIPDSVKSIGSMTFSGCEGFTSVVIPNSVTVIKDFAFELCEGLTSLEIPDSVTYIGEYAYSDCAGLSGSLVIPSSVRYMGDGIFDGCTGLTNLVNGSYAEIDEEPFSNTSIKTVLNLSEMEFTTTSYGLNADSVKDSLTTAGVVKEVSKDTGSDGLGNVASTLIKLVPILLVVSLLLVFIVPMVYKPN